MAEKFQRLTLLDKASQIAWICEAHGRTEKPAHTPRLFVGSDDKFYVLTEEYHTWLSYGSENATPETLKALADHRRSQSTSEVRHD